jgi:cytochrome P450
MTDANPTAAAQGTRALPGRILGQEFEPLAPETFISAHEVHRQMRATCPVAHSEDWGGFWGVFKYDDVVAVLKDSATYTTSVQNVVPKFAFTGRRPPLHFDPPEHTAYRRVINRFFTEEKMARLEPKVRSDTIDGLQPLIDAGRADIAVDFAQKLPAFVFANFFNLPRELSVLIKEVSAAYVAAIQIVDDETVKRLSRRLYEIAEEVIAQRTANPMPAEDDLTSALIASEYEGAPLPAEYVLGCVRQLLVTGMVAPSVFIGNMFVHLAQDQAMQDRLRADPALLDSAVEEYLRLYTPYRGMSRTARHDVEIGGRKILKDEPIALVYSSANRDETVFENPDDFVLDRPNINRHIGFGAGPHNCPGAPLARMMFRISLEQALARTTRWELDGEIKMARWAEWGTNSVPLKFTAA